MLIFSWLMVLITGVGAEFGEISNRTFMFLVLSGMATGVSWLCYFHALQIGDMNKVVPIDISSTVLTILLSLIFLQEEISIWKGICVILIGASTMLMVARKESGTKESGKRWLVYAVLSAIFASLTAILGKIGIAGVNSNLGTAIRTVVELVMAWIMVFVTGKQCAIKRTGIYLFVWNCHRSILAVLLSRIAERSYKYCGAD